MLMVLERAEYRSLLIFCLDCMEINRSIYRTNGRTEDGAKHIPRYQSKCLEQVSTQSIAVR